MKRFHNSAKRLNLSALGLSLFILLSTTFSGPTATAGAKRSQPSQKDPGISARLELEGGQFDQEFTIQLPQSIAIADVRNKVRNGSLMKQLNSWVKDASYSSKIDGDGASSMRLVIGGFGLKYEHTFRCKESFSEHQWEQQCVQVTGDKKALVHGAEISVSCQQDPNHKSLPAVCRYAMSGEAGGIKIPFVAEVEASEIAAILFVEQTSYLSQLSLLLSGQAVDGDGAKDLFENSAYSNLIADLDTRVKRYLDGLSNSRATSHWVLEASLDRVLVAAK